MQQPFPAPEAKLPMKLTVDPNDMKTASANMKPLHPFTAAHHALLTMSYM
jgi:hypothetical protein